MEKLWKGIAIAGIWLGAGLMAGDISGWWLIAIAGLAVGATCIVCMD